MLLGKLGMEPLFTLAAVGLMKLWFLAPALGWINLLLVAEGVAAFSTLTRFNGADNGPTLLPLPLLLLREAIARPPLFLFCASMLEPRDLRTVLAVGPTLLPLLLLLLAGILLIVVERGFVRRFSLFFNGNGLWDGLFRRSLVNAQIADV